MPQLAEFVVQSVFWTLAGFALLQAVATELCLKDGGLGRVIFPLLIAGGAAGASLLGLVPGLEPGTAIVAGLTAFAIVGLRKSLAAFLMCAVVVGAGAFAAMAVATLVGVAVGRLRPGTGDDRGAESESHGDAGAEGDGGPGAANDESPAREPGQDQDGNQ